MPPLESSSLDLQPIDEPAEHPWKSVALKAAALINEAGLAKFERLVSYGPERGSMCIHGAIAKVMYGVPEPQVPNREELQFAKSMNVWLRGHYDSERYGPEFGALSDEYMASWNNQPSTTKKHVVTALEDFARAL